MSSTSFKYDECVDVVISRSDEVTTIDLFDRRRHYSFSRCLVPSEKTRHVTDNVLFGIIKDYFGDDDMSHYYVCSAEHYEKHLSLVTAQTQAEKDELQYQIQKNEHERWQLFVWCEHYQRRLRDVLESHIDDLIDPQ